jgi:uncharacterized membrane protein YoaK (UPF0700 family)
LRNALAPFLGLAVAAGCVDAISFAGLRGVFTANMTGNMVLLGIGIASRFGYLPTGRGFALPLIALSAYTVGAIVAVPVMGAQFSWRRVALVVSAESALIAVAGIGYAFVDRGFVVPLTIGLLSSAMGAQSVAATRARIAGIWTTFVTGLIVTVVMKLLSSKTEDRQDAILGEWALIAYFVGATGGAAMLIELHRTVLFPTALIFLVLAAWLAYEFPKALRP